VADTREAILAQLVTVCTGVTGVTACVRNRLDQNLARPAIIILDGSEVIVDTPPQPHRSQAQKIQRMGLAPAVTLLVRGGTDAGTILSLYRSRIVAAVLGDATLADLVGKSGRIRYDGGGVAGPEAEGPEYRMELAFTFIYIFNVNDLVEAPP
jgi:hypothetical protein